MKKSLVFLLLALAGCLDASAAGPGINTLQIKTAAPANPVNLSGVSATEGTSMAVMRADATLAISGTLPEARGGTGAGALTCTNQFLTSNGTLQSCSTDVLASAQHANQGTATQCLHGNAAGNPSWAAVSLTADVSGTLPQGSGGTGAGALTCTALQGLTSNGTAYSCADNAINANSTLTGTGTAGSVLGINLANANTWTGLQTFTPSTSNSSGAVFNGNGTGNGANFTGGASGTSGTGANAYGLNVTGGSASGAGVPGPGINALGGVGAGIGAPGIVTTGGASAGTNVAGPQGIFSTGGAASGNAAGTVGGLGGPAYSGNGGAGGGTATGTGGPGGFSGGGTGGAGGAASGAGAGGAGGVGGNYAGGVGGASVSASGGFGGVGVVGQGGNGGNGSVAGGEGGSGGSFAGGTSNGTNGNGGSGVIASGGSGVGTGTRGNGLEASGGNGSGSGTTRGYAITMTQNGTIKAHTNKNPLSADPSSLLSGDEWISGTTTAMSSKVRLNGVTQAYLTGGANGARAMQHVRTAGCTTAATLNATCATTVTWPVAFPDASYTVECTGVGTGGSGLAILQAIATPIAASVSVTTMTANSAAAGFGNLHCIAIHD